LSYSFLSFAAKKKKGDGNIVVVAFFAEEEGEEEEEDEEEGEDEEEEGEEEDEEEDEQEEGEVAALQRCSAAMPLQTKQTQKKKVSILPDRWRVGLMGARALAPTPQQHLHSSSTAPQLHSNSSTARAQLHSSTATAPQLKLPLHNSSSGDGVTGGGVRRW